MAMMTRFDLPTPEEAEKLLADEGIDVATSGTPEMDIGKILLFSVWVGEEPEQLAAVSGLPINAVREIIGKLTAGGVFGSGADHAHDYFGEEEVSTALTLGLDIACAIGTLVRSTDDHGKPAYKMTDAGTEYVEKELLNNPVSQELMDRLDAGHGEKPGAWRKRLKRKERP